MRVRLPIQMLARASRPPMALDFYFVEHGGQPGVHRIEIEAAQVFVVEEAAARVRPAQHGADRGVLVVAAQVGVAMPVRFQRGAHHRPGGGQAAQHQRHGGSEDGVGQVVGTEAGDLAYGFRHGGRFCGR
jgi:hypothetical protein